MLVTIPGAVEDQVLTARMDALPSTKDLVPGASEARAGAPCLEADPGIEKPGPAVAEPGFMLRGGISDRAA